MKNSVRNYWIEFNTPLEGRVHYMYLDWKGWVSTGVGNLIDATQQPMSAPSAAERSASLAMAGQFGWTTTDGASAGADLIAADWDAVKARLDLAPFGHLAFASLTHLVLSDDEIDRMIFAKVDEMERYLTSRGEFADFDNWPADAQLAVLSMSWGMGPAFNFPNFSSFVAQGDWANAAAECGFQPDQGTIKIRNMLDAQCLRNAARVCSDGYDPEQLVIDLSNVLGVQIALRHYRFDPGPTDGTGGPRTTAAVIAYQGASGVTPTGNPADITAELAVALTGEGFTALTT
ncbi:peptidoglycan-binding protein [Mycobacterium sp. NPDC048908]|uniref:peptidoglycan-binding protein n=1 Tax=Mycobacterium sp. NPDC048908 TaxID=3364292 RepID=UPI003712026A